MERSADSSDEHGRCNLSCWWLTQPWVGVQKIAVVPTFNTQFDTGPIPSDWESLIMQRVLYDPDPDSAPDRIKEKESVQGQGHAAGAHPSRIVKTVSDTPPNTSQQTVKAFAGDYWSNELQVTYRLTIKDGKLWMNDLIGADGFVHAGTIPSNELRPVFKDEFDLKGAPITIHFTRDEKHTVMG